MIRIATLLTIACFLLQPLVGQTITVSGTVLDENGAALPGATIAVDERITTASNDLGRFHLAGISPGAHRLRSRSMGYATLELSIDLRADTTITMNMIAAAIDLREATVVARDANGTTATMQALDMRTRPVNTSQDLLTLVPGLFIAQHAGGGKAEQIFFRGFDIDHGTDLRISVDGMPVNMVSHAHGHGYADLHFTIPETMEELRVHKGPYDARFGDFATSGTVEFITRNDIENSQVKLERGLFNTMRAVALVELLDKKHLLSTQKENAYVAGEYAFTDAYFDSEQDFNRANLFGKYSGLLGERARLVVSASTFGAAWNASGQVPQRAVDSGRIDRFGAINDNEGGNTARTNATAVLTMVARNGGIFRNQLYFVKYDFNLYSDFTFFANDSVNGDMIAQTDDRTITGHLGTYDRDLFLGGRPFRFNAGLGVRHDRADMALKNARQRVVFDTIVAGSVDQVNAHAYLDGTLHISERFTLNGALRFDLFRSDYADAQGMDSLSGTRTQHRASPKLNFSYDANSNAHFYLRTGMGFHSNDARAVVVDRASSTLPRAYGADLGSIFKPLPRMLVNLAVWGLYLESELVFVGDGGVVETSDATLRRGIDLSVRYHLAPNLFADMDVNLVHARILNVPDVENRVPLAPHVTTLGGLAWQQDRGLSASLRYRHIADRPANEGNTVVAQGWFLLDAVASWRFERFEVGATAENLLNSEWNQAQFDTESRLRDETEAVSELHFTPGTPFFVRAFASARF